MSEAYIFSDNDVFQLNSKVDSNTLRRRLLLSDLPYRCSICGQEPYRNGIELILRLDHINGNHEDNRKENLRWICPNCDSQQETFCGRNGHRDNVEARNTIYAMSHDELNDLVANSSGIADLLRKMGLDCCRGALRNYIRERLLIDNIEHAHFLKLKERNNILPFDEVFCANSTISQTAVRDHFLFESDLYECECCGIYQWNGAYLQLQLDHKNGNNTDHRIENLRWLCPSCHTQTDTYCGRNHSSNTHIYTCPCCGIQVQRVNARNGLCYRCQKLIFEIEQETIASEPTQELLQKYSNQYALSLDYLLYRFTQDDIKCNISHGRSTCARCGFPTYNSNSTLCSKCANAYPRTNSQKLPDSAITPDFIAHLLDTSYVQVARELGVSDNAVRKRLRRLGIPVNRAELYRWYEEQTGIKHPAELAEIAKRNEREQKEKRNKKTAPCAVVQKTRDGVVIARFESMADAQRTTGVKAREIAKCVRGIYYTAGGYRWERG